VQYAFTEMLNNAIDHSGSPDVQVSVWTRDGVLGFEIADEGMGVFRRVREGRRLEDDFAALQEISKGKVTTDPARHTGEGIFFTSKVVDLFSLESGGLRWTVDNLRGDQAAGEAPLRVGTRVRCEVASNTSRTLHDVFDAYTAEDTHAFSKSRTVVRLFESGERFVSRSEAKRLARGLERFDEVLIDFRGVTQVGQGFVDELFRVWHEQRPGTTLVPVNMAPAVEAMVRRGLPPAGRPATL
jgi:anti-sigma regulatory factor (Ser/Thr protein kinase)